MMRYSLLSISRFFCAQKSYTSTFKIRSRLTQFFKHVHPDQLTQAPTKIKQQNLRSLTNFNSYIDSIAQSKSSQAKLLKFYIAQKTNLKSKKFFSFSVQLPELKGSGPDMNEQKARKLVDNIVQVLNRKFVESKNFRSKHGKVSQKSEKVESITIQDKLTQQQRIQMATSNIKPFNRNSKITAQQAQNLRNTLNSKYLQAERQSLSAKLLKTISFADTGRNKPMMWSRITSGQSGVYEDYKKIMDELIDPRLIYFDEALTIQQIQQFKKRLLPGQLNRETYRDSKIISEVCAKMESFEPPLCFYVSKKYSSTDIPGFFTIPYNFSALELGKYFEKQVSNVLAQQHKFQQYFDYYNEIRAALQSENNLFVDETNFKNNNEIWGYILMLKRLQRYRVNKKTGIVVFDKQQYDIFLERYKLKSQKVQSVLFYQGKIIARIDFVQQDMVKVIEQLSKNQEASSPK